MADTLRKTFEAPLDVKGVLTHHGAYLEIGYEIFL